MGYKYLKREDKILTWEGKPMRYWVDDFVDATGGTITYDGDYRIHTFTTSGTFTVLSPGDASVLVVGGGSGGWGGVCARYYGSGGAGGVVRMNNEYNVITGNYSVIVGVGSLSKQKTPVAAAGSSSFGNIIATGGHGIASNTRYGANNDDYLGATDTARTNAGGGAGAGGNASKGNGGVGVASDITGTVIKYGGGGGSGNGGLGVDGGGTTTDFEESTSGTDGLGGGASGGGSSLNDALGRKGGDGVVIIRYKYK